MRRYFAFNKAILVAMLFFSASIYAEQQIEDLKAAFILNFVRYTTWPNEESEKSFIISASKSSSIYPKLSTLSNKKIRNKLIFIIPLEELQGVAPHVLYLDKLGNNIQGLGFLKSNSTPILTVSHQSKMDKRSVINFVVKGEYLKFQINNDLAIKRKLHLSSRLLSVSEIITNSER